jgi:hypothetical protein
MERSYGCPPDTSVESPVAYAALLLLSLFLDSKGDSWVTRVIPRNFDHLSVGCARGDSPAPDSSGAVDYERK